MVMPEIVATPLPLFVMVKVCVGDVVPTFTLPKASEAGLKESARNVPSPDSVTTCGELGPSSVKESVALEAMAVCGVNVKLTVQEELTASVVPQVFVPMAK